MESGMTREEVYFQKFIMQYGKLLKKKDNLLFILKE